MRRKLFEAAVMTILSLALAPAAGAESPGEVYIIDAKIFAIPAGSADDVAVVGVTSRTASTKRSDAGSPTTFGDVQEIRIDDLTLTFDGGRGVLWNGEPEPPEDGRVEALASPRLRAMAGQPAGIKIASRLEYLVKRGDGAFDLQVTDSEEAPGVELTCTVEPADGGSVTLEYDFKLVVLETRKKISGVNLDVGRPVMRAHQIASSLRLVPGEWSVISGQMLENAGEEKGDFLLLLLRVRTEETD